MHYTVNVGDELLYPYVKENFEQDQDVSVQGFFEWCKEIKDPNYKYIKISRYDNEFKCGINKIIGNK
jgi:hypothetical protein